MLKLGVDRIQRLIKHNVVFIFIFFLIFHTTLVIFGKPLLIKLTNTSLDC